VRVSGPLATCDLSGRGLEGWGHRLPGCWRDRLTTAPSRFARPSVTRAAPAGRRIDWQSTRCRPPRTPRDSRSIFRISGSVSARDDRRRELQIGGRILIVDPRVSVHGVGVGAFVIGIGHETGDGGWVVTWLRIRCPGPVPTLSVRDCAGGLCKSDVPGALSIRRGAGTLSPAADVTAPSCEAAKWHRVAPVGRHGWRVPSVPTPEPLRSAARAFL
jgi:hypothetical protein